MFELARTFRKLTRALAGLLFRMRILSGRTYKSLRRSFVSLPRETKYCAIITRIHETAGLESWREEKRAAYLYRVASDAESGTARQILFLELAAAAELQADVWAKMAYRNGAETPPQYVPELRVRLVAALLRRIGPRPLRKVLAAMKVRGMALYNPPAIPASASFAHAHWGHRNRGGNLRVAIFGINDGLVSNASLILGVAGASGPVGAGGMILLSGVAGLLVGGFSMALGEYFSMRSQHEKYENRIGMEEGERELYPDEDAAELSLVFQARGLEREEARRLAANIIADPDRALDAPACAGLGLKPDEPGSPWGAALFSFFSFSGGAVVPLLPFILASGVDALLASIGLTSVTLFGAGAALGQFSGRRAWFGGLRMLAIGGAAGGGAYLIGKALGVVF